MRGNLMAVGLAGAALALTLVPAVAWAGGGGGSVCRSAFVESDTIVMRDYCFEGAAHYVEPGATIEVVNRGADRHGLTAVDGSFDTGLLDRGESATIQVGAVGTTAYYCTLHGSKLGEGMAGVLIVGSGIADAAGAAPAEQADGDDDAAVAAPTPAAPDDARALWGLGGALAGIAVGAGGVWLSLRGRRGPSALARPEPTPAA